MNLRLIIFTNLTVANRYADIAVTADIGSNFANVRFVDEKTGTRYYYGPKYWILRPEFYSYKNFSKLPLSQIFLETDDSSSPSIFELYKAMALYLGLDQQKLTESLEQNFTRFNDY